MMGERMKGERGLLAAAEAAEERSDEAGSAAAASRLDPEVEAKPKRRTFTAAYRLRILEEADRCQSPSEVGRLLRRVGLRMAERGGSAGKKRAIVAVARRLAVLLHRLWVTGEVYEPLRKERSKAA